MEADAVAALVRKQIDEYGYEETPRGTTIGVPSSEEKERCYRLKLEKALVFPYLQTFTLRDTFEQMAQSPADVTEYWVVAETEAYLEFYDPFDNECGLASRGSEERLPSTIGVRGDFFGIFGAM